jgi:hypothetical protein
VGGKTLSRFEEVVEATMDWKAEQCFAQAKDVATNAKHLNDRARLDKAADLALKTLREADIYMPGFSGTREKDVFAALIENVIEGGRTAAAYCEKVRPDLTQTRLTSIVSKAAAAQWNSVARVYLGNRAVAEQALSHLEAFTLKYKIPHLYADKKAEITHLLAKLDEYQYYPEGTAPQRLKIQLRIF